MTDAIGGASTTVEILAAAATIALDIWGDVAIAAMRVGEAMAAPLPGLTRSAELPGGWRAIRVEPTVWWLIGPLDDVEHRLAAVETALGDDGAATDLSGAVTRISIAGPAWRGLLMMGGVFDAEDPDFGPGRTAGTLLHHVSVRHDVVAPEEVHVHVAPSYADDLTLHLRQAVGHVD